MKTKLSPAEHKYWYAYMRMLADRMGLKQWTIQLMTDLCEEDVWAQEQAVDKRYVARIRLSEKVLCTDRHEQRDTIVHELLHVGMTQMDAVVDNYKDYERPMEYVVDWLSSIIAPTMPLPPTSGSPARASGSRRRNRLARS